MFPATVTGKLNLIVMSPMDLVPKKIFFFRLYEICHSTKSLVYAKPIYIIVILNEPFLANLAM